jgi:D-alanyl-lipoteichoic acid acyltransferase DltB (MBOAT superfamily)
MKPVVFLRIASVLTFIHSVLHTIGGVFSGPEPGISATTWAAMKPNVFPVFGLTRSYFMFYRGFGLGITIVLTAEAMVFWQLSSLAKTDAARLRPVMATFMIAYLAFAVNSYEYFFYGPVVTEILIAACLGLAIATAKRGEPARSTRVATEQA